MQEDLALVILDPASTEDGALDDLNPAVAGGEADVLRDRAGGDHKLKVLHEMTIQTRSRRGCTYRDFAVAPFNIEDNARMRAEVRHHARLETEENIGVKLRFAEHDGE